MSNRIPETKVFPTALIPQSIAGAGNATGPYNALGGGMKDVMFLAQFGALAQTKKMTMQVYQADDGSGTNAAEITDAKTEFTAPTGGVTNGQLIASIPLDLFSKPYAAVKITNGDTGAVVCSAVMVLDPRYYGKAATLNSQASAVMVVS